LAVFLLKITEHKLFLNKDKIQAIKQKNQTGFATMKIYISPEILVFVKDKKILRAVEYL